MLHLKRTLTITLLFLALLPASSYAEQAYQTELIANHLKIDRDSRTTKYTALSAEVFFSPVNTDNKPLAEAAFLDKSSSIFFGYAKQKTDLENSSIDSFDVNGPAVGINYVTDNNAFILSAIYIKKDFDTNNGLIKGNYKTLGASIGKYLDDASTIEFSYIKQDDENRNTTTNQTFNYDTDQYEISYKTVQSLDTTRYYSFGLNAGFIKSDSGSVTEDNQEVELLGQYYFTRMTSLGAGISLNSGDDISQEGKALEINATHFFLPQIAVNIGLSKFIADDSQEDSDRIQIQAAARF